MKYNFGFIFVIFLAGLTLTCGEKKAPTVDEESPIEKQAEMAFQALKNEDFEIILIDNCEYLIFTKSFNSTSQGYGFMAHKGNCSNPIHCYKDVSDSSANP